MDINYDLEQRLAQIAIQINALATLLIAKEIITNDEYKGAQDAISNDEVIKERLDKIECGARIQKMLFAEETTDEDIQWVKENGPKYDTEENVNKIVEVLKLKKDPLFGKLFNDKL